MKLNRLGIFGIISLLSYTVLGVVFSLAALILQAISARQVNLHALGIWAVVYLCAMLLGPIGTAWLQKFVFGLFERLSTFSAVLGWLLLTGKFQEG